MLIVPIFHYSHWLKEMKSITAEKKGQLDVQRLRQSCFWSGSFTLACWSGWKHHSDRRHCLATTNNSSEIIFEVSNSEVSALSEPNQHVNLDEQQKSVLQWSYADLKQVFVNIRSALEPVYQGRVTNWAKQPSASGPQTSRCLQNPMIQLSGSFW